jgi:CubicO group peptidase (beta-lactamase class C family)
VFKKFMIKIVLTISLLFSGIGAIAQEDSSRSTLEYQREMYKLYQHSEFDLGGEASRFAWREISGLFPHAAINHDRKRPLSKQLNQKISDFSVSVKDKAMTFEEYVSQEAGIDSVIILHKGNIVYQRYKTHGPFDRHLSWSVTKVITATALARLENMGKVNMQSTVGVYLPELADSVWGSLILQDVVDMASGIDCRDSDGYQNKAACVYRSEESLGIVPQVTQQLTSSLAFLKTMKAHRAAGEETEYTSSNAVVAGLVIEAITGRPLSRAIANLVWQPMGAEADGLMIINKHGEAFASGGISARLSDIARFGLMFLENDQGWPSISKKHRDFLRNKHRAIFSDAAKKDFVKLFDGDVPLHSRWQWDMIWADGDMYKEGYSGQGVYIAPGRDMVMAWFGTADKAFQTHHLLPLARKLSQSSILEPPP